MLRFVTLVLIWCTLASSNHADAKTNPSIETVQKKFTAFDQHDVAAIEEVYSSDAVLNSPDYHQLVGNESIAETYRKLFEAIPDARDEVQRLEFAGGYIYAQYILSGHWNGVRDQPVSVRIISVYKVENGHIVDDATYYDRKAP